MLERERFDFARTRLSLCMYAWISMAASMFSTYLILAKAHCRAALETPPLRYAFGYGLYIKAAAENMDDRSSYYSL